MSRWSTRSLIRSLMSRRRLPPAPARARRRRSRPQVEALEDRLTPAALAGQLDLSFNHAGPHPGYHYFDLADGDFDGATALAAYADGALIAAGTAGAGAASDFALARFNANGTLDTIFGDNGAVRTTFHVDTVDELNAVVLQHDGKIIVAGVSDGQFALARYHTNGTLDRSFGNQGKVVSTIDGTIHGIALQEGKIVAVGQIVTRPTASASPASTPTAASTPLSARAASRSSPRPGSLSRTRNSAPTPMPPPSSFRRTARSPSPAPPT